MKGLVLAGGFPQIDLIIKLKERKIKTILADYYEHPIAKDYADKFYRISTLDTDAIRQLAIDEHVDFVITVCTDQALLTAAKISEDLALPCYIDYETAKNVTNKSYMKKVFIENQIPTAKYVLADTFDLEEYFGWKFPLIVKPVDCNSSKGVRKVTCLKELKSAFVNAINLSRTNKAIIEEFIVGKELSVDVYVDNGRALVLDVTTSEKLREKDKFIIFRTWHPANISAEVFEQIQMIVQHIADSFKITNAPMLIQMLTDGRRVFVIEFSARTGGGVKHFSIERCTGIDIISTIIDLTLGIKPQINIQASGPKYMLDEYIYCQPGVFDHVEGFEQLKQEKVIIDYYVFKWKGAVFDTIENSGDRIGGFTIQGDSMQELKEKHKKVNLTVSVLSPFGKDIMRHDLLMDIDEHES